MPEGSVAFVVDASPDRVWSLLSDMHRVGECIPEVEGVEHLDDGRTRWDLRVKLGPFSQAIAVTTETLDQVPPFHGKFRGEAHQLEMIGTVDLTPEGPRTKVVYSMSVRAKGPLSRILDGFIRSRLRTQTEEFAENMKRALQAESRHNRNRSTPQS